MGIPTPHPWRCAPSSTRHCRSRSVFSAKEGDGPYRLIGTDNNPPYRVFYRFADADAELSFKAVVDDLSGHLGAAAVENVRIEVKSAAVEFQHKEVVVHYLRSDGDYGDADSDDFNQYWGLHIWGEAIAAGEEPQWQAPRRFEGRDDCGVYTVVPLRNDSKPVNFIVHRGDTKDGTDQDRNFHPRDDGPEVWLKQDDPQVYTEAPEGCPRVLAAARQQVTFHYLPEPGQEVNSVSLRGSMNEWGETPMAQQADGSWSVTLELAPGEYSYKYFINGEWPQNMATGRGGEPLDAQADQYADDGFGGRNAVRVVGD